MSKIVRNERGHPMMLPSKHILVGPDLSHSVRSVAQGKTHMLLKPIGESQRAPAPAPPSSITVNFFPLSQRDDS